MAERYLVTGGAGFIGSHIARRLLSDGASVRIVDNLTTGLEQRLSGLHQSLEFIRGDLADSLVSDDAVKGVDFVLHQAAIPSVQRSVADPLSTNRANVTATLNILESCRKAGVRRVVFAASSSAYGDTELLPKVEEMPPDPLSPYALQKLVGERYCQLYYRLYGLETVSLRYFNVFGPSQDPHSEYSAVIPKFIAAMQAKKAVTVYGDGEQSRDFTYVDNVVDANLKALRAPQAAGRVCNIGCGERITLNTLIRSLEEIIGIKADVIYASAKPGDVRHSLADITSARRILGYEPKVGIEDGLRRTVTAFKAAS
jgi:nucleoside-diphosphate-sugar epimerase